MNGEIMEEKDEQRMLGNNSIEDASWLCSLSESELDFLISLKQIVEHRADVIGCKELKEKFDLKMLRALGLVLMEHLKGKVEDLSHISELNNIHTLLDDINLLKCNPGNILSVEEIKAHINVNERIPPHKRKT